MVHLTKGGFWLSVNQIVLTAISFGSAVILARFLPQEIYGNYKYILSAAAIVGAFSLGAMGQAVTNAAARGAYGALPQAFKTTLLWGIGMVILGACGAAYYFFKENATLGTAFLLIASCSPFLIASSHYDAFLEGRQLFREKAVMGFFRNALPVITVAITVMMTANIVALLIVYFLSNTISCILVYRETVKRYVTNSVREEGMARFGFHLSIMGGLGTLATNIDKILIFQLLGGAPLAIYSFAQAPISYLQTVAQMLKTMILPRFAARTFKEIEHGMPRKAFFLFLIGLLLLGTYYFLAPTFFKIFFPAYLESVEFSQILAFLLLLTPGILPGQALLAHNQTRELYFVRVFPSVLRAALFFIFIPIYGIWGAVYALIIAKFCEHVFTTIIFLWVRHKKTLV